MKMLLFATLLLAQATLDPALVDNDRVNVRERPTIGGPTGSIVRQTPSEIWISVTPAKAIVITLKDKVVAPIANTSGFPNAFPRPNNKKVYEDARVIVWDYTWAPGDTRFNLRDRVHTETLVEGQLRAIITELK